MSRILLRHLKALRRHPVPTDTLSAGRIRLAAVMASSPRVARPSAAWFVAPAWKPALIAVIAATTAASGGVVFAAQGALPGETLYAVKLASEKVSEHLMISPERRFTVQAEHAERRLDETKELLARPTPEQPDQAELVRATMDRYEDNVFAMNEIAAKMVMDPAKHDGGRKTMLATEAVLDRHADLVASATADQPISAEAVLDHFDASLDLEANVFEAMPEREKKGDEQDEFDRRRQERTEKIEGHLDDLRHALRDRRAP